MKIIGCSLIVLQHFQPEELKLSNHLLLWAENLLSEYGPLDALTTFSQYWDSVQLHQNMPLSIQCEFNVSRYFKHSVLETAVTAAIFLLRKCNFKGYCDK
jgi:hypothetical protein